MTDNQHEHPTTPDPAAEEARRKEAHRQMRRRLFRAGLAAVPAMLTLRARPALAQQGPSGTVSQLPDYGLPGHWECTGSGWIWTGYIDENLDYPEEKHWDGTGPAPPWDPSVIYWGGQCDSSGSQQGSASGWLSEDGGDDDCCGDEW